MVSLYGKEVTGRSVCQSPRTSAIANCGKEGKPTPIETSINQETLAEMIGTTRSSVSVFLNKFRKLGLFSYNGNWWWSLAVERCPARETRN
jgi:CRP-like cAMP-binding protein